MKILAVLLFFLPVSAFAQCFNPSGPATIANCVTAVNPQPTDLLMIYQNSQIQHTRSISLGNIVSRGSAGADISAATTTATGSTTPRTLAAITADTHNVLSYGADPTGVADSTSAINAALAADASGIYHNVYMPPGTYHITSALTITGTRNGAGVITGQCLFGDNQSQAAITVGYDYSPAAGSPLTLTGNAFGSPCVNNLWVQFSQPSAIGNRSNFATLSAGCGTNGKGCEYPAAIGLTNANNSKISDILVGNAWECVSANWTISNGANYMDNILCGAFNRGLDISGSVGIVFISNYHFYPWGISGSNNSTVYLDGNTYAAVFTSDQGITAANFFSQNGRVSITGSAQPAFAHFTNLEMDEDGATLEINSTSTFVTIAGGYSDGSATGADTACQITMSGASTVMVSSHEFRSGSNSNLAPICIAGGQLDVSNSELVSIGTSTSIVSQTGGNLILTGNNLFTNTGTWTVPLISSTGGNYTITGNQIGGTGASGVAISGTDGNNTVFGNTYLSGWTFTPARRGGIIFRNRVGHLHPDDHVRQWIAHQLYCVRRISTP